jgi:hypothetical protein
MSRVSVPESGEKIRLGAKSIATPTPTRAAATHPKSDDGRVASFVMMKP